MCNLSNTSNKYMDKCRLSTHIIWFSDNILIWFSPGRQRIAYSMNKRLDINFPAPKFWHNSFSKLNYIPNIAVPVPLSYLHWQKNLAFTDFFHHRPINEWLCNDTVKKLWFSTWRAFFGKSETVTCFMNMFSMWDLYFIFFYSTVILTSGLSHFSLISIRYTDSSCCGIGP